ncbi:arsenate reductase ArsC [bacterium]|nr:arsenate reductase ArsC [bacterium]MBL7052262.1 arsenate reductase ArsC [Candidatus Neomarinimicrobiota bacterium]
MKKVLFVCTGNTCRSQMAEGLLRHYFGKQFVPFSAGSHPSKIVNPRAVQVMAELEIDISHHQPKSIEKYLHQNFDFVITLCDAANEHCPVFHGDGKRLHWGMPDPYCAKGTEEEILAIYRNTRDKISEKIRLFLSEI